MVDLLTVLDSMDNLIFVFDQEGRFEWFFQPSSVQALYRDPEHFLGKPFRETMPAEIAESFQKAIDMIRESGQPQHFDYLLPIRGKDTWFHARVSALRDSHGQISGFTTVVQDLTEWKQRERRITQEQLRTRNLESLGILAGGIAHDFNNILTAIMGNVNLAKLSVGREHQAFSWLEQAEQASKAAQGLAQQLSTFSKGGAPVKQPLSLANLLKEATDIAARGSKVSCELELPGDLWPVEVDRGQMRQAFNNLILNAVQAMPRGGVIRIRAENLFLPSSTDLPLQQGRYVRTEIQDKGCGIEEKHLGRIFDPYFTTKPKASGMGLASVHSIITKHGGHVGVRSIVGKGTTFTLLIPALESQEIREDTCPVPPAPGRGRVLVMDDEDLVRRTAEAILDHLGYDVTLAKDGPETVEIFSMAANSENPFDLVILDLTIHGGWGGLETIKVLRKMAPGVKAIVSSGYYNDPVISEFRRYGFSGVICKPYCVGELSKVLSEVMGKVK